MNWMIPGYLNNFRVRLCHTGLAALTSSYEGNYDGHTPVQVFYEASLFQYPPQNSWFGYELQTPFAYDGTHNLIVEVWWDGGGSAATGTWQGPATGRFAYSYVLNGNPVYGYPNEGLVGDTLHYMRLTIEPSAVENTSLGRVKTLYR